MKINILRSSFQTDDFIWNEYAELIDRLKTDFQAEIQVIGDENVKSLRATSLPDAVMIATGGVENLFKTLFSVETRQGASLPQMVTLIADGRNNSLAAALEILTWLEGQGVEGRIVHDLYDLRHSLAPRHCEEPGDEAIQLDPNQGSSGWIASAKGLAMTDVSLRGLRIGVFGKPSDWLIASGVDRDYLLEHFGVETVDIDLQRVVDGIKAVPPTEAAKVAQAIVKRSTDTIEPSCADMVEAAKAYLAIKKICQEERLHAMTIRCFDIVKTCSTTSCLALALLNDEGIVAGCEGDMQTLMSMLLVKRLCGAEAFMANPSQLTSQTSMLAHCTIPLNMCDDITFRSHFESGIGVAIQGTLPLTDYTIFKWGGPKLDRYYVAEGKAIEKPYSNHFCRTQITLDIDLRPYLLKHSIGNHHVIIKGKYAEQIKRFMNENVIASAPRNDDYFRKTIRNVVP